MLQQCKTGHLMKRKTSLMLTWCCHNFCNSGTLTSCEVYVFTGILASCIKISKNNNILFQVDKAIEVCNIVLVINVLSTLLVPIEVQLCIILPIHVNIALQ